MNVNKVTFELYGIFPEDCFEYLLVSSEIENPNELAEQVLRNECNLPKNTFSQQVFWIETNTINVDNFDLFDEVQGGVWL
jgi:hypothetical protein